MTKTELKSVQRLARKIREEVQWVVEEMAHLESLSYDAVEDMPLSEMVEEELGQLEGFGVHLDQLVKNGISNLKRSSKS